MPREDAVDCAISLVEARLPQVPWRERPRRVYDDGDQWIVSFHLPDGWSGGGAVVLVGKFGGSAIIIFTGQ